MGTCWGLKSAPHGSPGSGKAPAQGALQRQKLNVFHSNNTSFFPRDAMLARPKPSQGCLSVRLSHSWTVSKRQSQSS